MSWKLIVTTSAKTDITAIKQWYRGESLQAEANFVKELVAAFDELKTDKIDFKRVHDNHRRLLLKKFPYVIYYKRIILSESIEVKAVFHKKRQTGFLFSPLGD